MPTLRCAALVAAVLTVLPWLPAQVAPPVPFPSPAAPMVVTDRFLFVLRGDVLYQFDVYTLRVLNTHRFDAGAAALPQRAPGSVSETAVVEPPPPPPPPPEMTPEAMSASIDLSLTWLAKHQDDEGKWDCDGFFKHDDVAGGVCDGPGNATHDVGVTGLALLAFLGNGNTMRSGPHKDTVRMAVSWLRSQQGEDGLIGVRTARDFIYDHAIATFALCEAYGLSGHETLKPCAQKAIDYLESHRNPYSVWRYQPRDNDNDTSVTTWAVLALESGKFFGLQVNQDALKLAAQWYDQVTSPDGRSGYTKQGEGSSRLQGDHGTRFPVEHGETMTAAALFARFCLGQSPEQTPILKASADLLASKPPKWAPGHVDAVYWYFGTYAMYQMGGAHWTNWSRALGTLLEHQRRDGNAAGSWDPVGVWDVTGGRVFVTALDTLSLEASAREAKLKKK